MDEFMTINDFIKLTGLTRMTICRAINKIFPGKMKNGVTTKINKKESEILLNELRIKNLPDLNKNVKVEKVKENFITKNDLQLFFKDMIRPIIENQQKQNELIIKLLNNNLNKQVNQIEHKQDYQTILGYCNIKKIKLSFSEMMNFGKKAAALSREKNISIIKVEDQRFGMVNGYHIDILNLIFSDI